MLPNLLPLRFVKLEIDSGGTYASNTKMRVLMQQLASFIRSGKEGRGHEYLVGLIVRTSITFTNSTGGAVVYSKEKQHDVFRAVRFQSGIENWYPIEFPYYGGTCLRQLRRLCGRSGVLRADSASIANAGTHVSKIDHFIPLFDPRARKPSDFMIPAEAIAHGNGLLEMTWCAGASEFGASSDIAGSVTEVVAVLTTLDHFRVPPRWGWKEQLLKSKEDSTTLEGGRKFLDVALLHKPASQVAGSYFTTTTVSLVNYRENDVDVCRDTQPASLVAGFGCLVAGDDDSELAVFDASGSPANDLIPLKTMPQNVGINQLTKGEVVNSAKISITGTLNADNAEILTHWMEPATPKDLVTALRVAKLHDTPEFKRIIANPDAYAKGAAEDGDAIPSKEKWLPQKLLPTGRRARTAPGV